jgi:hypothetical protein
MSFVPMLPVGQVIAGNGAADIMGFRDMDGMSIAILEGSYQQVLPDGADGGGGVYRGLRVHGH